jgi:hypothetical protein
VPDQFKDMLEARVMKKSIRRRPRGIIHNKMLSMLPVSLDCPFLIAPSVLFSVNN